MSVQGAPASKADPETLALRASPRPVVRLNRRTLIVAGAVLAALVLGGTIWSLQPTRRARHPGAELYNVERVSKAESLDRLPKDYTGLPARPPASVPVLGEPLPGDLGPAMVRAERNAGAGAPHGYSDAANAERLQRLRDAEEAARSGVFFRGGRTVAVAPSIAASGAQPAGRQPFDAMASLAPSPQQASDPTAVQSRQEQKEAFVAREGESAVRHAAGLQLPASPYQIMAGTVIPAALLTGINSDLPGQVIASVTESLYDTATGRHLLIPQGSRLIGRYDSQISFGQRRVLLVWTRLVLPDTSSVALDRLPGIDTAGYAGLEDGVDWHWDRILAGAALSTLLGVGAELAAPSNRSNVNGVVAVARESVQDTVNDVGQEMTRRNLSIQPTLTVRPGFALRVMVGKDLVLRPYQPLIFSRGSSQ